MSIYHQAISRLLPPLLLSSLALQPANALELSSQDISEGHAMGKAHEFNGFGCSGENLSPQLSWSDIPQGTKSFAITVYDPDAPTGSGWWHWSVVDIPAGTQALKRGESPLAHGAKAIRNDYGTTDFGGACPPEDHGMHRYAFTIWALPTESLSLPEAPSAALVGYMLNATALDSATLTATYHR